MLICTLVTAKRPSITTSMNDPRPISVNLLTACSLTVNVWRYSSAKNKSKSSISISKYEQKR